MIERPAVVGRVLLLILILFVFLSSTQAQIQPDASSQVSVIRSGLVFNRATNTYDSIATIINISSTDILAPLSLVLTINPSTVTLANASGATADGKPFIDIPVSGGILSAGTAVSNIVLKFHNPDRVAFSVTTQVLGPLIGPVSSPVVGVVVGSSIQAISPKVAAAGSGPIAIVITGSGLEGVTGVNITPSQGLSLEAFSVSSDGKSVTVPITVAADAAPTVRMISLTGTTGPYLPAAPDADRIQIVLAPL